MTKRRKEFTLKEIEAEIKRNNDEIIAEYDTRKKDAAVLRLEKGNKKQNRFWGLIKSIFNRDFIFPVVMTLLLVCSLGSIANNKAESIEKIGYLENKIVEMENKEFKMQLTEREKYINERLEEVENEIERSTLFIADQLDTYFTE